MVLLAALSVALAKATVTATNIDGAWTYEASGYKDPEGNQRGLTTGTMFIACEGADVRIYHDIDRQSLWMTGHRADDRITVGEHVWGKDVSGVPPKPVQQQIDRLALDAWFFGDVQPDGTILFERTDYWFKWSGDALTQRLSYKYPVKLKRAYIELNDFDLRYTPGPKSLSEISEEADRRQVKIRAIAKQLEDESAAIATLEKEVLDLKAKDKALERDRIVAARKHNAQIIQTVYLEACLKVREMEADAKTSSRDLEEARGEKQAYERLAKEQRVDLPILWAAEGRADLERDLAKVRANDPATREQFKAVFQKGYAIQDQILAKRHRIGDIALAQVDQRREAFKLTTQLEQFVKKATVLRQEGDPLAMGLLVRDRNGKVVAEAKWYDPSRVLAELDAFIATLREGVEDQRTTLSELRRQYVLAVQEEKEAFRMLPGAQVLSIFAQAGVEVSDFMITLAAKGWAGGAIDKMKDIAKEVQCRALERPKTVREFISGMWDYDTYDQEELRKQVGEQNDRVKQVQSEGYEAAGEVLKQFVVDAESWALLNRKLPTTKPIVRWLFSNRSGAKVGWIYRQAGKWFAEGATPTRGGFAKGVIVDALRDYAKSKLKKGAQYLIERPYWLNAFASEAKRQGLHEAWFDCLAMLEQMEIAMAFFENQRMGILLDCNLGTAAQFRWLTKETLAVGEPYTFELRVKGEAPEIVEFQTFPQAKIEAAAKGPGTWSFNVSRFVEGGKASGKFVVRQP